MKMRALNNRWTCPVCGNVLRPQDLLIDSYVDRILADTPCHIEEVLITEDGGFICIEEMPDQDTENGPQVQVPDGKAEADDSVDHESEQPNVGEDGAAVVSSAATSKIGGKATADDGDAPSMVSETININDDRAKKRKTPPAIMQVASKRRRRRERAMAMGQGIGKVSSDSE